MSLENNSKTLFVIILASLFTFSSCNVFTPSDHISLEDSCQLSQGSYPVQSAEYNDVIGQYKLIILNTPSCFKQPLTLSQLKLGRNSETSKEKAKIFYMENEDSSLLMADDFLIKLTQMIEKEGEAPREHSSMWSPMLSGAVGAVAGAYLANKIFNRPQYVTPPPVSSNGKLARGVGSHGSTKEEAVRSYQRKYQKTPSLAKSRTQNKKNFFKQKSPTKRSSKGQSFFSRKSKSSYGSSKRKGFFRSKRR